MKKVTDSIRDVLPKSGEWQRIGRMPFLVGKAWWVKLDADLVALLSGEGTPVEHLRHYADRKKKRAASDVQLYALTDAELRPVRSMLRRLGAEVWRMKPAATERSVPRRKKAG